METPIGDDEDSHLGDFIEDTSVESPIDSATMESLRETTHAVLASLTALIITFMVGPAMIRKLTAYKIGQSVRDDGPQTHLIKAGTPTMGGALILVSVTVTTLLWADLQNRFVWIVLLVTLGFGAVGWVDDYRKVVHRNPKGLSARAAYRDPRGPSSARPP